MYFFKTFKDELPKEGKKFVIFSTDYMLCCSELKRIGKNKYEVIIKRNYMNGSYTGRYADETTNWCYIDDMKAFLNDADFGEPYDPWSE